MASMEKEKQRSGDANEFALPTLSHLQENENRILDYLENQLPAIERRSMEDHLALCPECETFSQRLKQLDIVLAQNLARPGLSAEFTLRMWKRIEEEPPATLSAAPSLLKQQLETEFRARSAELRKSYLALPELLTGFGYAAVAAIAAFLL